MKRLIIYIALSFFCNLSLQSKGQFAKEIIKQFADCYLDMQVTVNDLKNITIELKIINHSSDTILLYKPLLPTNGMISEKLFTIVSVKSSEAVKYNGPRKLKYLYKEADPAFTTLITVVPDLDSTKFIILLPNSEFTGRANIASMYDFSSFLQKNEKKFFLNYSAYMPIVTTKYIHVHEKDSFGDNLPVYFLPDITSQNKRGQKGVFFKIHN